MEVIVMKEEVEERSAMDTGVIRSGISPFASDGLNEPFRLAIGLGAVRSGEEMLEAELPASGGKEIGAVSGAAIGEDALDADAVSGVKVDGLAEGIEDTGSLFVGEKRGEGEAGMIVDGDVEAFSARARVAMGTVPCGADTGFGEASELLDVEMEEIAWSIAFVADGGRFGRFQRREAVEVVAAEHTGKSGFGDWQHHPDLGVRAARAAQGEDLGFEGWSRLAGLMMRDAGTICEAGRKAGFLSALQPSADRLLADAKSGGGGALRQVLRGESCDHFSPHERGECGISVHVVRAQWLEVEYSSTTSLPYLPRADNLLKHDT